MERIVIVTDSTAGLSAEVLAEWDIPVIPLNVHWGEVSYKDGETLDAETFYRWLQERADFPKTSQPSAGEFMAFFDDVARRFQTKTIVGIFISSELSGTCASALLAQQDMPELDITVFDSRSVSMGAGLMVLEAARMAREGASKETLLARLAQLRDGMHVFFAVDTLEYLHRGGRIGGAARFLGTALNLKPILMLKEGRVESLEKVRLRRKSLQRVVEVAAGQVNGRPPATVAILHTGGNGDLGFMTDLVEQQLKPLQVTHNLLTPVVGTHVGPGALGVVFYTV
ncbi:MAG TPA: DegV family protein [Anaerolineae bacterium]|nr:DegV family protein [Anaerolineae bacterium]